MLFGYPIAATEDNWLHDCICEILRIVHNGLQGNQEPMAWPEIIPEQYRAKLNTRTGLKNRLATYSEEFAKLNTGEQNQVIEALDDQNEIGSLLSCECDCASITDLPESIRESAKALLHFSFKLLTELGVRDNQYTIIYESLPYHVCPFCGCEYFDAPGAPREALDHYLPGSKYPFASFNLRNLVPMGNKCNSRYKHAQDILVSDDGVRRRSFDPYNHEEIQISLENSEPFAGTNGQLPRWQIDFEPNNEEVETWDDVFHIRERYKRDVLDPLFKSWLRNFKIWCRSAHTDLDSAGKLSDAIRRFCTVLEEMGFDDRAFLKTAVFKMLLRHCEQDNQRLITLLLDLVD